MLDVDRRCGMARIATWTSPVGPVRTPGIAFVHTRARPAPDFAELRVATEDVPDVGVTFSLGGSFFRPRGHAEGLQVPPSSGLPLHAADLDVPEEPARPPVVAVRRPEAAKGVRAEVLIFDHGPELLANPRRFVRLLVDVREAAGPVPLLWVPGIGAPSNLALLAYCGVDIVDSARVRYDGLRRGFHTVDGLLPSRAKDPDVCDCDGCRADDPVLHNEMSLIRELRVVRQAIRLGTLRELAERRSVNEPWTVAVLRHLDLREQPFQEAFFAVDGGPLRAYSPAALNRPDVVRFRGRVLDRYTRPPSAVVAVLLPCSARKPYSRSKSHRLFREAIRRSGRAAAAVHEIIITSPFGVVPRDLEVVHPVRSYDVPVTGDWSLDEGRLVTESLARFLEKNRYETVIAHLGSEAPFVAEAAPGINFTATSKPTSGPALDALAEAVRRATAGVAVPPWETRRHEDTVALASYQFGAAGPSLLDGTTLRGRPESVRIFRGAQQFGALTPRGRISLTIAGAEVLASHKAYTVGIEDFVPEGNVFAIGVTVATPDIRIGDEVAVSHNGEVRAVGTARMPWREMVEAVRGEAVRVRHRAVHEKP